MFTNGPLVCLEAVEKYLHVVLFIMLHKVVLTLKFVNETLGCEHSNESYWAILSYGTVYYAVPGVLTFESEWNSSVSPFNRKLLSNTFMWYCSLQCGSNFKLTDETLVHDHANESY